MSCTACFILKNSSATTYELQYFLKLLKYFFLLWSQDTLGHWSDEYEIDSEDSDVDDINFVDSKTLTHAIIEQETAFSCHGDKNILMCHQF